jgi:hypothetical protein
MRVISNSIGQHLWIIKGGFKTIDQPEDIGENVIYEDYIPGYTSLQKHFSIYVKNKKDAKKIFGIQLVYQRDLIFYIAHVVMPLLLLQIIELTAYKLDPIEAYNDIISLIIVVLLTTVAFRFSLVGVVPVVSYVMFIDYYILFGYILPTVLACLEFCFAESWIDL